VGDIMEKLHERGLDENTLVIFTSDNGPHEEGSNKEAFDKASGPLRGIKRDVYEGGDREPFIARWPGHIAAGVETGQAIAFWDFMPTAMELAGGGPGGVTPGLGVMDGISFLPTLLGRPGEQKQHEYFYWEFHENGFHQAVLMREGNWKGVRHGVNAPIELYNLNEDLGEKDNVAAQHADVVEKVTHIFAGARVPSGEFKVAGE